MLAHTRSTPAVYNPRAKKILIRNQYPRFRSSFEPASRPDHTTHTLLTRLKQASVAHLVPPVSRENEERKQTAVVLVLGFYGVFIILWKMS